MTPKQIAESLTEAQRRAVMRPGPHIWAYLPTIRVLDRFGIVSDWQRGYSGWANITPLGLAVRAVLMEEPKPCSQD